MKHTIKQKIYYQDTDAYGVLWHGAYLRFFEMARMDMCHKQGFTMSELEEKDIIMPVARLDVAYKMPIKLEEEINIVTSIEKFDKFSMTFKQEILKDDKICASAHVRVVAVNKSGKLYHQLPKILSDFCATYKE